MTLAGYNLQDNVYIYSNNKCMCVFLISPVPITKPLTSELIDTPVFYNLAPRPIKYRVSVPIPSYIPLKSLKSVIVPKKILSQIFAVFLLYIYQKILKKGIMVTRKILSSTTVFNISQLNCFYSFVIYQNQKELSFSLQFWLTVFLIK